MAEEEIPNINKTKFGEWSMRLAQATGLDDPESEQFKQTRDDLERLGMPALLNISETSFRSATTAASLAQTAGASAKTGSVLGVVVAAIIIGGALVAQIVQSSRQAEARALQVAAEHGQDGAQWGKDYLDYWKLARRKPFLLPSKAFHLEKRLKELRRKKETRARLKRIAKLSIEASALATVMSEIALSSPLPAEDVLDTAPVGEGKEPRKSTILPLAAAGFTLFQLLG